MLDHKSFLRENYARRTWESFLSSTSCRLFSLIGLWWGNKESCAQPEITILHWQLGSGKVSTCQCRRHKRHGFNPWVRKIPWRKERQPTPVFLPGESHGQRSLVVTAYGAAKTQIRLSTQHTHNLKAIFWSGNGNGGSFPKISSLSFA